MISYYEGKNSVVLEALRSLTAATKALWKICQRKLQVVSLKHYCGFQRDFSAENRSAWKVGQKNLAAVCTLIFS